MAELKSLMGEEEVFGICACIDSTGLDFPRRFPEVVENLLRVVRWRCRRQRYLSRSTWLGLDTHSAGIYGVRQRADARAEDRCKVPAAVGCAPRRASLAGSYAEQLLYDQELAGVSSSLPCLRKMEEQASL